jgi:diguanylate cyclase (GGDEF)-like protein
VPPDLLDVLAESGRLVARGGDLGQRLDGLAQQAARAADAATSVIYLLDGDQAILLPGGAWGLGPGGLSTLEALNVGEGGEADAVGRAVRARHPAVVPVTAAMTTGLPAAAGAIAALAHVPLVTEGVDGTQQVEGLLTAGFAPAPGDDARALAALTAVGDLAAAAIRQARLEQALVERSDWFERLASTDALTGLANRRTFERLLELELVRAGRQGTPVSLALFDIDGLGAIDRERGADVADDVLRRVASALAESVRLVDTIARFGGDEFALLAPGTAGVLVARRVMAGAARAMAESDPPVSLSVGVAHFPDDGATGTELQAAATGALAAAKAQGRGSIVEAAAAGRP